MTPVKWVAQQFIRKGAAIGNYLWVDSQDIGSIDKAPLRQCDNWLMGRMKEAHEVERILKQLLGMKVPAEEIQTLPLGHFYAVVGNNVHKVYVLPVGVPEDIGRKVAQGQLTPEYVRDVYLKPRLVEVGDEMFRELYEQEKKKREELEKQLQEMKEKHEKELQISKVLEKEVLRLKEENEKLQNELSELKPLSEKAASLEEELKKLDALKALREAFIKAFGIPTAPPGFEPAQVGLEHKGLVVNVHHAGDKVVKVSTDSVVGQILFCSVKYFRDKEFAFGELNEKMLEHGWNVKPGTLSAKLSLLSSEGKLIKTDKGYRLPSLVKFEVKEGGRLKNE
jgi:hypothetical protein